MDDWCHYDTYTNGFARTSAVQLAAMTGKGSRQIARSHVLLVAGERGRCVLQQAKCFLVWPTSFLQVPFPPELRWLPCGLSSNRPLLDSSTNRKLNLSSLCVKKRGLKTHHQVHQTGFVDSQ